MHVVVVGGGVIGLLTAVRCVLARADVTVVDQAELPYARGASYDWHRVVRALHPGDLTATRAAVAAQRGWSDVEHLLGARLQHRTGALTVRGPDEVADDLDLLAAAGAPARSLRPAELAARHPHIRVPAGSWAVVEANAGVVLADRALAALVAWLRSQPGARLTTGRPVVDVDADAGSVRLADGAVVRGDAIVLAGGPWSRDLLPIEQAAKLTLHRQSVLYCDVPQPLRARWAATPVIALPGSSAGAWLVPPVGGTPLKLSAHSACRAVAQITDHDTSDAWREHLLVTFGDLLGDRVASWVIDGRDCYYLAARDTGGPLLVALGDAIWAYAACGGSSFKFAPLIAQSLAALALGLDRPPTGPHALHARYGGAAAATATAGVPDAH